MYPTHIGPVTCGGVPLLDSDGASMETIGNPAKPLATKIIGLKDNTSGNVLSTYFSSIYLSRFIVDASAEPTAFRCSGTARYGPKDELRRLQESDRLEESFSVSISVELSDEETILEASGWNVSALRFSSTLAAAAAMAWSTGLVLGFM